MTPLVLLERLGRYLEVRVSHVDRSPGEYRRLLEHAILRAIKRGTKQRPIPTPSHWRA